MILNLLFDLGGVIMDIRRERCVQAFERLGMADIADFLGDYGQKGAFAELERGDISPDEFRRRVRQHIPHPVSDSDIDDAFMQFLIGIPRRRLELLGILARRYNLYLLSNTNPIMWNAFIADQFRQEGKTLDDYFKGSVTSFTARALKPDHAIFRYAAEHLDIEPEHTLFLDDSDVNCRAARQCGYHAVHVADGAEFADLIAAYCANV